MSKTTGAHGLTYEHVRLARLMPPAARGSLGESVDGGCRSTSLEPQGWSTLAPGLPISGHVATVAFLLYLGCRLLGQMEGQFRTG